MSTGSPYTDDEYFMPPLFIILATSDYTSKQQEMLVLNQIWSPQYTLFVILCDIKLIWNQMRLIIEPDCGMLSDLWFGEMYPFVLAHKMSLDF